MAGSGRRFAFEAAFLVGLAVAVGLAGLSAGRIIGVMALGWLFTALVELVSWRLALRHPRGVAVLEAAPSEPAPILAAHEAVEGVAAQVPVPVAADPESPQHEPTDEAMAVAAEPEVEGNPEAEAREAAEPLAADEQEEADPVEAPSSGEEADARPPERRRGLFRRRPAATDQNEVAEVASQPRHVRLIPRPADVPSEPDPAEDGAVRRAEGSEGA